MADDAPAQLGAEIPPAESSPMPSDEPDSAAEANIAAAASARTVFTGPGSEFLSAGPGIGSHPAMSPDVQPGGAIIPAKADIDSALAISAPGQLDVPIHLADPTVATALRAATASDPRPNASASVVDPTSSGDFAAGLPAGLTTVRYEIALTGAIRLTVPFPPDAADLEAIREAAAPLLHLLAARSLTTFQGAHE